MIFQGIGKLKEQFPGKAFTVDGRLVGDVGEVIAALEYEVDLYDRLIPVHDGETSDGRKVEIFNGPGSVIAERFSYRSGFGEKQFSFRLAALRELSESVFEDQRVPRRIL